MEVIERNHLAYYASAWCQEVDIEEKAKEKRRWVGCTLLYPFLGSFVHFGALLGGLGAWSFYAVHMWIEVTDYWGKKGAVRHFEGSSASRTGFRVSDSF